MALAYHHVALCVADWERSHRFYTVILGALGASQVAGGAGAPHRHAEGRWCAFSGGAMLTLWESFPEHRGEAHVYYAPGLHHVAFAVDDRAGVDAVHAAAVAAGADVIDPPHEDGRNYLLFLRDPDGMKLEFRFKS